MAQVKTTTTRTTVVTEVPDERRWQGRDWVKTAIAGGLALALLRPGAQPAAAPQAAAVPQPTAVAVASPLPAVVSTVAPTVAATAAATAAPTVAPAAVAEAPLVIFTREVIVAGPRTLQGTGTAGSTVEVLVNGASAGTALVGADGRWQLDATLEAGTNEVVANTIDATGAVLAEGEPVSVAVEAALGGAAASAPTFDAPAGDVTGGPVQLSGTGQPGSTVRVRVGGVDAGTATVGADGRWVLDAILVPGSQEVVVEALDSAGAVVAAAPPAEVNAVGGAGVTLREPAEGATLPVGPTTISGTGVAGTVLEILDGDRVLGEVTVGADGAWTTQVPLEAGTAAISVREQGAAQLLSRPVRVQVGGGVAAPSCTEIAVGCQAWVTRQGGLTLRMRSAAAIVSDNVVARLPIGTQMEVLEGPTTAAGLTWWRVRTGGGNEGWVAGDNLVLQPD
jgi:hypothetical protein